MLDRPTSYRDISRFSKDLENPRRRQVDKNGRRPLGKQSKSLKELIEEGLTQGSLSRDYGVTGLPSLRNATPKEKFSRNRIRMDDLDDPFLSNVTDNFGDEMANQQGWANSMMNALVGGVPRLVLMGGELISRGSPVDLFGFNDRIANSLAQARKYIAEEALPIHMSPSRGLSSSEGVWMGLGSLIESVGAFALVAAGTSAAIGATSGILAETTLGARFLGSLTKAAQATTKRGQALGLLSTFFKTEAATNVATALFLNEMEGSLMAYEVYKQAREDGLFKYANGELENPEDVETLARQAGSRFKRYNRAMILQNLFEVNGIMKGIGYTRSLRAAPTIRGTHFKNLLKFSSDNLALQGLGEAGEEIYQAMGERAYGDVSNQTSDEILKAAWQAKSDGDVLYEGILGFIGGVAQRGVLDWYSNRGKDQRKRLQDLYFDQQSIIEDNSELIQHALRSKTYFKEAISELDDRGDSADASIAERMDFADLVTRNFHAGTTQSLEDNFKLYTQKTDEELAEEFGVDAEGAQGIRTRAAGFLRDLAAMESDYIANVQSRRGLKGIERIGALRIGKKILEDSVKEAEVAKKKQTKSLDEIVSTVQNKWAKRGYNFDYDPDNSVNPYEEGEAQRENWEKFKAEIEDTVAYSSWKKADALVSGIEIFLDNTNEQLAYLESTEGQNALREKDKEVKREKQEEKEKESRKDKKETVVERAKFWKRRSKKKVEEEKISKEAEQASEEAFEEAKEEEKRTKDEAESAEGAEISGDEDVDLSDKAKKIYEEATGEKVDKEDAPKTEGEIEEEEEEDEEDFDLNVSDGLPFDDNKAGEQHLRDLEKTIKDTEAVAKQEEERRKAGTVTTEDRPAGDDEAEDSDSRVTQDEFFDTTDGQEADPDGADVEGAYIFNDFNTDRVSAFSVMEHTEAMAGYHRLIPGDANYGFAAHLEAQTSAVFNGSPVRLYIPTEEEIVGTPENPKGHRLTDEQFQLYMNRAPIGAHTKLVGGIETIVSYYFVNEEGNEVAVDPIDFPMKFHGLEEGTTNPMKDKNGNIVSTFIRDSSLTQNLKDKDYPALRIEHKEVGTASLKAAAYERLAKNENVYVRAYETRGKLIPNVEKESTLDELLTVVNQDHYLLGIVLPNGRLVDATGHYIAIPKPINQVYRDENGDPILMDSNDPDSVIRSSGSVYAVLRDTIGKLFPVKLKQRHLNRQEAELIYDLLIHGLTFQFDKIIGDTTQNPNQKPIVNEKGDIIVEGITPLAALDLLTYPFLSREAPHNIARNLKINFKKGQLGRTTVTIGDQNYRISSLRPVKQDVIEHLMTHKVRAVKKKFLDNEGDDNIVEMLNSEATQSNDTFTFLGEEINEDTKYRDLITKGDDPVLTTDLQLEGDERGGPPIQGLFYHPQVYLEGGSSIITDDNIEDHLGTYIEPVVSVTYTDLDLSDTSDQDSQSRSAWDGILKKRRDTATVGFTGDRIELTVIRRNERGEDEEVVRELVFTGNDKDGSPVFRDALADNRLYSYSDEYLFSNLVSYSKADMDTENVLTGISREDAENYFDEGGNAEPRNLGKLVSERSKNPQEIAQAYVAVRQLLDDEFSNHPLKSSFAAYGLVTWDSFQRAYDKLSSSGLLKYLGPKFAPGLGVAGSGRFAIPIDVWVENYNRDNPGRDLTVDELADQIVEMSDERAEPVLDSLRQAYRLLTGRTLTDIEAEWVISADDPFSLEGRVTEAEVREEVVKKAVSPPRESFNLDYSIVGIDETEFFKSKPIIEPSPQVSTLLATRDEAGNLWVIPNPIATWNEYIRFLWEDLTEETKDARATAEPVLMEEAVQEEGKEDDSWIDDVADEPTDELFLVRGTTQVERDQEGRIDIQREVAWLKKRLPYISVDVIEDLVNLHGTEAYGLFKSGVITLSKMGIPGTAYHEAFHAVFNSYLDDRQRAEIIDEAREKFPALDSLSDREVEEFLSQELRFATIDQEVDNSFGAKVKRFFERIIRFIQALRHNRVSIEDLFRNIELGVYAYKPKPVYRSTYYHDYSYLKIDNFSDPELLELRNSLAYVAVKYSGLDYSIAEDRKKAKGRLPELEHITHANFDSAKKYLTSVIVKQRQKGNREVAEKLEQILKDPAVWRAVQEDLKLFFERLGVESNDLELSLIEDAEEEERRKQGKDFDTRKPYEYSQKERARSSIKLALAMLPEMETVPATALSKGLPSLKVKNGRYFGMPKFIPFASVWGRLESLLEGGVPINRELGEIESMEAKLERIKTFDPNLEYLIIVINQMKKKPRLLKQLALAFQLNDSEFRSFLWNPIFDQRGKKSGLEGADFSSRRQAGARAIIAEWASNMESMGVKTNPHLIRSFIEDVNKIYKSLTDYEAINRITQLDALPPDAFVDEQMDLLKEAFNSIGINIEFQAINFAISVGRGINNSKFDNFQAFLDDLIQRSISPRRARGTTTFERLVNLVEAEEAGDVDLSKREHSPLWSVAFTELADAKIFVDGQGNDTTVTVAGKNVRWIYGPQRWLQRRWAQISQNPSEHLRDYESSFFTRIGSTFYNNLLRVKRSGRAGRSVKTLRLVLGLDVRNTRSIRGDKGKTFEELSKTDKTVTILNLMLKGVVGSEGYNNMTHFPLLNMSDRLDQFFGHGYVPVRTVESLEYNENAQIDPLRVKFHSNIQKIVRKFMISELMRTRVVYDEINSLHPDELISTFHGNVAMEEGEGIKQYRARLLTEANGLKMLMFPELSPEILINSDPDLFEVLYENHFGRSLVRIGEVESDEEGKFLARKSSLTSEEEKLLNPYANNWLRWRLKTDFDNLVDMELMMETENEGFYEVRNKFIHKPFVDWYRKFRGEGSRISEMLAVVDALSNSLVANVEQMYLNHGDWAFYKDVADIGKRAGAIMVSGIHPIVYKEDISPTFKVIVLRDIIAQSEFLGTSKFKGRIKQILREQWGYDDEAIIEKRAEEIVAPYREVNTTDAQAYITLDRFKEIMVGIGRWRPEYDAPFEDLKAGKPIDPKAHGLFLQPLKGVYWNLEKRGEHLVPVYLKYSQAVLLPSLVKGNTVMENLLARMNEEGIGEAIYESGIKVGASGLRTLQGFISGDQSLAPIVLQNEYWKLQSETPYKGMKNRKIGTQQRKNVFAAIADYFLFEVSGKDMSASDWKKEMNHLYSALSDIEMETLRDKWGIIDRGSHFEVSRHGAFVSTLKRRAAREGLPNSVIEMFDLDESGEIKVPFSTHAMKRSIQHIVLGVIRRYSVESNSFGGSMIQISGAGIAGFRGFSKLSQEDKATLYSMYPDLLPPQLVGKDFEDAPALAMQPDNIKKIKSGRKDVTTRTKFLQQGYYKLPDGTVVHISGRKVEDFTKLSSERQEDWAKREGFDSLEDAKENAKFKHTRDFIEGKRSLYVYKIRRVSETGQIDKSSTLDNITAFSGAASGSDTLWFDLGQEYGIKMGNIIGEVHEASMRRQGRKNLIVLTDEQLEEADEHVAKAYESLPNRDYPMVIRSGPNKGEPNRYTNDLLRRNWFQIKNAKAVYAIANDFDGTTAVQGGTGWGVQMAIDNGKAVFVFVDTQNSWFTWNYEEGKFNRMDSTPTLVNNAALIGTRGRGPRGQLKINEKQANAIRTVYEETLKKKLPSIAVGSQIYKPGDILLPSWFADKLPENIYNEDGTYNQEEVRRFFNENPELSRVITYRVPGQARFSIDSARVVGFLPPEMGDSIIMYDEVTVKTGSDFDIDKMYLMLPEFYINSKGEIRYHKMDNAPSLKEDGKTPTAAALGRYRRYVLGHMKSKGTNQDRARLRRAKDKFEQDRVIADFAKRRGLSSIKQFIRWSPERQNGKGAITNRIIEMYHGLLSHPAVYLHSVTPIESIKLGELADEIEAITGREKSNMPDFFTITNQLNQTDIFGDSKGLISQTAVHIVNHALLQDTGVNIKGGFTFSNIFDTDKEYIIVDVLSGILNGALDAVKNPYLHYLGMNEFTAQVALTMIRAGIPYRKVFKFLKQPIIEELSQQLAMGQSEFYARKSPSARIVVENLEKGTVKKIQDARNEELISIFPELSETDDLGVPAGFLDSEREALYNKEKDTIRRPRLRIPKPVKEALEKGEVFKTKLEHMNEDMLDYYLNPDNQSGSDFHFFQRMFIREFSNWSATSRTLGMLIRATRVDTLGPGSSIASLVATRNRINEVLSSENTNIEGAESIFRNPDNMITTYYRNSVLFSLKLLKQYFLELSPFYESALSDIRKTQGDFIGINEEAIQEIHNSVYSYQLMEFLDYSGITDSQIEDMFIGPNNMVEQLKVVKQRWAKKNKLNRNLRIRKHFLNQEADQKKLKGDERQEYIDKRVESTRVELQKEMDSGAWDEAAKTQLTRNEFLDFLDVHTPAEGYQFIRAKQNKRDGDKLQLLIAGFEELLEEDEQFAKDIGYYSIVASGGRRGTFTFHDVTLNSQLFRDHIQIDNYFKEKMKGVDTYPSYHSDVLAQVYAHNYNNKNFVRQLSEIELLEEKDVEIVDEKTITIGIVGAQNLRLISGVFEASKEDDQLVYKPFLYDVSNERLYQISTMSPNGTATYKEVRKLGYYQDADRKTEYHTESGEYYRIKVPTRAVQDDELRKKVSFAQNPELEEDVIGADDGGNLTDVTNLTSEEIEESARRTKEKCEPGQTNLFE